VLQTNLPSYTLPSGIKIVNLFDWLEEKF
jgi:hypothetical protein